MAIQDFTAGQVLTAAQMDSLQANDYNWTVSTKTVSYVLVAADKGTRVVMNSASATTITVNTNLFAAGDTLYLQNIGAGTCTVTAGTATVTSAGPLAIPQWGSGTLYFTSASASIYFPSAITVSSTPTNSTATVATQQTTTSTSYTDLATSGPAVTITTGTKALVIISAGEMRNQNASGECDMSFAVSGATTTAAADATSVGITSAASNETFRPTGAFIVTVTAGSNTFTAKYRVGGGTGVFANRRISVIDMGS